MRPAGLHDCRRQPDGIIARGPQRLDRGRARLGGENTVKRLSRSRERIVLLPENRDFESMTVAADAFAIEGIYVGVIRVP